jgi:hypothetical protein
MKLVFRREGVHRCVPSEEASDSVFLAVVDNSLSGLLALITDPCPGSRLKAALAIRNVALCHWLMKGLASALNGSLNLAQHQSATLPTPGPWSTSISVLERAVATPLHIWISSERLPIVKIPLVPSVAVHGEANHHLCWRDACGQIALNSVVDGPLHRRFGRVVQWLVWAHRLLVRNV